MTLSLEMEAGEVERFSARAEGDFDIAVIPQIGVSGSYSKAVSQELWSSSFWVWTTAGPVPVGVEVGASITANASVEVSAEAGFLTGFRQTANMGMEGVYIRDTVPAVSWDRWFTINPIDLVPFTYTLHGEGEATVSLVPQIDVRLYGAAGLYMNVDPRLTLSGAATMTNGTLTEASWLFGAYADVNAGLSVIGIESSDLPALPPFRFFTREWGENYALAPADLQITRQPQSENAKVGDSVVFAVEANGSGGLSYQWYHQDSLIPGATHRELRLNGITNGFAGDYFVRVNDANEELDSSPAKLSIVSSGSTGPVPAGMVCVDGGTLSSSNYLNGTQIATFYIGRYEVTWREWQAVRTWAANNGYDIGGRGEGCADDYPVHSVAWFDAIKWCNAKSQMEGLTPIYGYDGAIYKTGEPTHTSISQNLSADGYRLPLTAEWEFAARGGNFSNSYTYAGSDDINTSGWYNLNSAGAECDLENGRGTWPVGQKIANELELYDMSGNVWEWCWDIDSRDKSTRVIRGGSWRLFALLCEVSEWISTRPITRLYENGFRLARSSSSAPSQSRIISLTGDLNFGDLATGTSAIKTLTISNNGNSSLTVTGIELPTGFTGDWSGILSPAEIQNVDITFTPMAGIGYGSQVRVFSNRTGGGDTHPISGAGIANPGFAPNQLDGLIFAEKRISVSDGYNQGYTYIYRYASNNSEWFDSFSNAWQDSGDSYVLNKISPNELQVQTTYPESSLDTIYSFETATSGTYEEDELYGGETYLTTGEFHILNGNFAPQSIAEKAYELPIAFYSDGSPLETRLYWFSSTGEVFNYSGSISGDEVASYDYAKISDALGRLVLTWYDGNEGDVILVGFTSAGSGIFSGEFYDLDVDPLNPQSHFSGAFEETTITDYAPETLTAVTAVMEITEATYPDDIGTSNIELSAADFDGGSYTFRKVAPNFAEIEYTNVNGGYSGEFELKFKSSGSGTFREMYSGPYSGENTGTFTVSSFSE